MADIRISFTRLPRELERDILQAIQRAIYNAMGEIAGRLRYALVRSIEQNFVERTGTLRGSPRVGIRRRQTRYRLTPVFPATKYVTEDGKGGQYAFVLNATNKPFIQEAVRALIQAGEIQRILQKHISIQLSRI